MSNNIPFRALLIGLALWSNGLVAEKIQYLDEESEISKNIRMYVSNYFDALSKHDVSEYAYLSENFHSTWRRRILERREVITNVGLFVEENIYFVIVEGAHAKIPTTSAPYLDIIYLNQIGGGFQINESSSYPEFERAKKLNFHNRLNYGVQMDSDKFILQVQQRRYKRTSRPAGMAQEEWEQVWEKHWEKAQERKRENEAIGNVVLKSFEELAERYKITYYEDQTSI